MRRIININEIGANMVDRGAEIKRSAGSFHVFNRIILDADGW